MSEKQTKRARRIVRAHALARSFSKRARKMVERAVRAAPRQKGRKR